MTQKKKKIGLAEVREAIFRGDFGPPGQRFPGVKALAAQYAIGMDRAQEIFRCLREEGVLMLVQKSHYLSHGRIPADSPLGKMRQERNLIALLADHLESYYIPTFADSAAACLAKEGYRLITCIIREDNYRQVVRELYDMGVQGFLVLLFPDVVNQISRVAYIPCTTSGYDCTGAGIDSIVSGGSEQAKYLADMMLEAGCERFFFVTPRRETLDEKATYKAFFGRLREKTGTIASDMVITEQEVKNNSAFLGQKLTACKGRIGIVCTNEQLTQRVMQCCMENKIPVPDKVMLAAFRTKSPMNQQNRNIITVEENIEREATEAVNTLLKRIHGDASPPKLITVEPKVINRLKE